MDILVDGASVPARVNRRQLRSAEVAQAAAFIAILSDEIAIVTAAIEAIEGCSGRVGSRDGLGAKRRLLIQSTDLYETYYELNRQVEALRTRFPETVIGHREELELRRGDRTA
ncbi:hypothetical protein [Antrihabitans stalactiti]|uniref:Uncharacterized protein n=1 Tax=Antrihabitans stalactiti TaxID=2584121 RepID=A0A848KMU1_9NOCA|nr:hypothetical protein [Antrihabitans stalactiti]NMN97600.1 hypothetical protein [Antrihabitans stalactiti]